jgi:hypothetical protein
MKAPPGFKENPDFGSFPWWPGLTNASPDREVALTRYGVEVSTEEQGPTRIARPISDELLS